MKSVLLVCSIFPPQIGGPSTYAENLVNFLLSKNIKTGVITYTKDSFEIKAKNKDFSLSTISRNIPLILRELVYLIKLLAMASQYEVLYAQSTIPVGFLAFVVSRIFRKKFILRVTGDHAFERASDKTNFVDSLEDFQNKKYNWWIEQLKKLDHFVAKKADQIITPSRYLQNILVGWGLALKKINLVYNAFIEIRSEGKIELSGEVILSVGRLIPLKGFDCLIKIMPDLLKINPSFKLVIVGEGGERKHLEKLIRENNLQSQIILTGALTKQELVAYYTASDIFVLNSSHDTFPNVILEAMAYSLPVIASNVGGVPEMVEDGVSGLLFSSGNKGEIKKAILRVHKDSILRERLIYGAKEKLKDFDYDKIMERTLEVLS